MGLVELLISDYWRFQLVSHSKRKLAKIIFSWYFYIHLKCNPLARLSNDKSVRLYRKVDYVAGIIGP